MLNLRKLGLITSLAVIVILLVSAFANATSVRAQNTEPPAPPADFPYEVKLVEAEIEQGETVARQQWALSGFDPSEFGGNDDDCTNTELDNVKWADEISSPSEDCRTIFEWSLKNGDQTLASGMFALEPEEENVDQAGEWIRFNFDQVNGRVYFTGSMWRLPKGWNAHQLAVDFAADWQEKNEGIWSVVGLSPTDPWIQAMWQAAEVADGGTAPVLTPVLTEAPAETEAAMAEPAATEAAPTAEPAATEEPIDWAAICPAEDTEGNKLDVLASEKAGKCSYAAPVEKEPTPSPSPEPGGPQPSPYLQFPWEWFLGIALGVLGIGGLVYLFRRTSQPAPTPAPAPVQPVRPVVTPVAPVTLTPAAPAPVAPAAPAPAATPLATADLKAAVPTLTDNQATRLVNAYGTREALKAASESEVRSRGQMGSTKAQAVLAYAQANW